MARTTVEKAAANIAKFERGLGKFGRDVTKHEVDRTLIAHIRRRYFKSGGRPNPRYVVNRSGRLSRSIHSRTRRSSKRRTETLLIMEGPQATTIEEGRRRTVVITPRRRTILRWVDPDTGKAVFARRVVQPPSLFPARAPLARGIKDKGTQVIRNIERALEKEWDKRIA